MYITDFTLTLALITTFFFLFLAARGLFGIHVCALCASTSITWLILLVFYWFGKFHNLPLIALLMGGSVVGIYYLAEEKTRETLHIFRLPFYLTLLFAAYLLVARGTGGVMPLLLVLILWVLFGLVYAFRVNPAVGKFAKRLIECCKNW